MSKIYEALLRAEIDRLAAANREGVTADTETAPDKPRPVLPHHPPQLDAQPDKQPEKVPVSELVAPPKVPTPLAASTAAPIAQSPIDLSAVQRMNWKPSLPQLPSLLERGAPVEQFRGLRSRLHEFRDLNVLKTLLISSGLPEEGKSYIAANIAISFARHKTSRVLLIDGDMRRGSLHRLLGTHSEPGLTEYLSGKATIQQIIQTPNADNNANLPKGLASLSFIPCGADAENASDLSGNSRFEVLLQQVSPLFDWIIVDSSPVNLVADGANLARHCDAVLLVTRGGVTKYETAQRALGELKAAKVIGVILNAVQKAPAIGGYYGYDSYDKVEKQEDS